MAPVPGSGQGRGATAKIREARQDTRLVSLVLTSEDEAQIETFWPCSWFRSRGPANRSR